MRRHRLPLLALLPLLGLAVAAAWLRPAHADEETPVVVELRGAVEADAVGDLALTVDVVFPAATFAAVKAKLPDPRRFLQDLMPSRANYESTGASATYDDPAHAVRLAMTLRGAVKNAGGGRWEFPLEGDVTLLRTSAPDAARAAAWFREKGTWEGGIAYTAEYAYGLPEGATQARFDPRTKVLSWRLPPVAGTEAPRVTLDLRARDRLMSTIYKVYGLGSDATTLFWVAKAVFRNEGGPARNLRVRYRLGQYGDWSPWSKHPELAPGQTVVDVHYPVLDPSIAKLRSNTPANLLVEYSYEDGAGRKYEDDAARKVVILGVNEYVFGNLTAGESFGTWEEEYNNAPLLAAWVTRNDPVVKQFAAMANRMAGGVGATSDQASAERVLRACYELLQRNDFSYQHPPALLDKSVSFDAKTIQNVKLPRETIRDRSGTCIDLAILYAAMVNALGLEPHLALIPGHCFPVVRMPDKKLYAVEVTGVQGGLRTGSADFDRVYAYGLEELRKAFADGRIYLLDLHELWTKGIANPEIEDLPPDILQRWGITEEGRGGPTPGPGPGGPATPPAGGDVAAVVGTWGGPMGGFKIDDELVLDELYVGVDGPPAWKAGVRLELTFTRAGVAKKVRLNGLYDGAQVGGGAVRFPRTQLKRTDVGAGTESQIEFYALTLRAGADGRLEGAFEGDGGFTFKLLPKTDETAAPTVPEALAAVAGSWGGGMGAHDIGQGTLLDEMYVDAAPGDDGFVADVKMKVRLSQKDDLKVEIDVHCTKGRVDGDVLRFPKVPWRRTVPSTGQKDEIAGNVLTLQVLPDGRLKGVFEGDDGLPFTLLRRGEPPPTAPPASPLADLAGTWGGSLGKARINDTLAIPEALVTFAPSRDGTWSGAVDLRFTVTTPDGAVDVRVHGAYPPGRAQGDAILFPAASLERVVVSTGERSPMDGNPMELRREPDGRLEVKFTGDDGFALTLSRATGAPPPARTPAPPAPPVRLDPKAEACIGRWGGRLDQTTPDGYFVETFTTEVKRTGAGVYEATQQIVIRLTVNGRTDRLTVTGAFRGNAGGQGLVLASTSRRRTLASTGATEEIGAGTLEVHVEDGKLTGRVGNATDGYTPFSLIPAR